MSLLDVDKNVEKIDLGIIKMKLRDYMIHHYGSHIPQNQFSRGYINKIRCNQATIVCDFDIFEEDLHNLVMYYTYDRPDIIHIIRNRIVYRREWLLLYVPITISSRLRLLTVKDVLGI